MSENDRLRSFEYIHAQNTTDNGPIAQIPPLHSQIGLSYGVDRWRVGFKVRMAAEQTRVDDDINTGSGLDVGKTAGYVVLDCSGMLKLNEYVSLQSGIDNVFDHTYAEHLNKANAFDPEQVQVNEPGINAWVRLAAQY